MLGGRLRLITSGGAPITPTVMNFSRIAYGCPLVEGYGQTECCAGGTLSLLEDTTNGHVGGPSAWAQVKLSDVPEMNYWSMEDRGEVCFRGAAIMTGYFHDEQTTKQTIDQEGWLHTGDIGMWLPNGALRIIDRKNHIFKLAQGDFVSPETIEQVYCQHPLVTQVFVHGSPTRSCLVAIVVPNIPLLRSHLGKHADSRLKSLNDTGMDNLLQNKAVREEMLSQLRIFGASKVLNSF